MKGHFLQKTSPIKKDSSENILRTSNRKPKMFETDEGKDFVDIIFAESSNKKKSERCRKHSCKGATFGEKFSETIREPLKTFF